MTEAVIREKTCCFTGHRRIPTHHLPLLRARLTYTITQLAAKGYTYFIAGGALGFDTLAAEAVLTLRNTTLPEIRLLLAIPCERQAASWPAADVEKYEKIRADADGEQILSTHYFTGCMQKRNRYMVDHASLCIAYLTEEKGGTASTVTYANKQGLSVINLADAI